MYFPITAPDGTNCFPVAPDGNDGRWRIGFEKMKKLENEKLIHWENKNGKWIPYEKEYYEQQNKIIKERSILYEVAETGDGSNALTDLFGIKDMFLNPKPIEVITKLIRNVSNSSGQFTILDFFAGSGTTLHATMKLNAEDGGNRQCILVQQSEGDKNICEQVTYERNKRVINGYTNAKGETVEGLGNSLKYYRTAFVGKNPPRRATDYDKTELSKKAGCLLALAENTLEEIEASNSYQIFSDGKKHYTGVYFTGRLSEIQTFTQKLETLRDQNRRIRITAYFFCWGDCAQFEDEFTSLERISLQPIPKPILDIYQSINR